MEEKDFETQFTDENGRDWISKEAYDEAMNLNDSNSKTR